MNLSYIKYFCDAAREGSLKKASELNFVTPGAISQGIIRLEAELGVQLMNHKRREFSLTHSGQQLLNEGGRLLSEYEGMVSRLRGIDPNEGEFEFGTQQSIALSVLPGLIRAFKAKNPKILPKFHLGNTSMIRQQLVKRRYEFGVCLDNVDFPGYQKATLLEGRFVLISRKADAKEFLLTSDTPEVTVFKKEYLKKFKKDAEVAMNINSWGVIKEMVMTSNYAGLVPDYLLSKIDSKYVIEDNLGLPLQTYKILAVWPLSKDLDPKSKLFLDFCKMNLKK